MGVCNWVGVGAEWVPIVKGCTRWKQQMGVYEWVGTGAERVPLVGQWLGWLMTVGVASSR